MGQRLNIQIQREEEIIANAYYDWSAYTMSSLGLLELIEDKWDELSSESDDLIRAVRLLEATGASFTDEDLEAMLAKRPGFMIEKKTVNRMDGLIGVSEKGINETIDLAEGSAIIFLEDGSVLFNVFEEYDDEEQIIEEYDPSDEEIAEAPHLDFDEVDLHMGKIKEFKSNFTDGKDIYKFKDGRFLVLIC